MTALQSAFYLLIALSILIVIHEWGHYFVAVRSGVRVLKFSIGFGPELIGVTRGGTRWCVSAIPLGGFVRFAGDDPEAERTGDRSEFLSASLGKRTAIVLAGPTMNYILAVFLFAAVRLFEGVPVPTAAQVSEVADGSLAERIGVQESDVFRAVNGVAVGSWDEFTRELHAVGPDEDFVLTLERGGSPVELRGRAPAETGLSPTSPLGVSAHREPVLGYVQRGGAAWNAGLRSGDRIRLLDDTEPRGWLDLARYITSRPGAEIAVVWERDGHRLESVVVPESVTGTGESGETETFGTVGAMPFQETRRVGPWEALVGGWDDSWSISTSILAYVPRLPAMVGAGLKALVTGDRARDEGLGGPVRIAEMLGKAARWGALTFLTLMASLSVNLAVLNLLPIPVLDGGHLAFHLVELVTRRPPSLRIKLVLQQIGFALLVLLMLSVTAMDVGRLLR